MRYFFLFSNGAGIDLPDAIGDEIADDVAAEAQAVASAQEMMLNNDLDWRNCVYKIRDERGRHVSTVRFDDPRRRFR